MLKIPHSIQALQDHVTLQHPALLDYCTAGWEALPDRLKKIWLEGLPRYSVGCFRVRLVDCNGPRTWTSWGEFACENIKRKRCRDRSLWDLVKEEISDEGMFFGLPPIPDGFHKFSKDSALANFGTIAVSVADEYLYRARVKAERYMVRKIEKEGIAAMQRALEADDIFHIIGEEDDSDEAKSSVESESDDDGDDDD